MLEACGSTSSSSSSLSFLRLFWEKLLVDMFYDSKRWMLYGQATSWKLEDAIQLFYVGNEGGGVPGSSVPSPPTTNEQINSTTDQTSKYVCPALCLCLWRVGNCSSIVSSLTLVLQLAQWIWKSCGSWNIWTIWGWSPPSSTCYKGSSLWWCNVVWVCIFSVLA